MTELIGIQGFMMGGKGACKVIVTNDYGEGLGVAKTFRYNSSAINDRAHAFAGMFALAFATNKYPDSVRPGDVINKTIINSGLIFGAICIRHKERTMRNLPSAHVAKNPCVIKARDSFFKRSIIEYCGTDCTSTSCPVNAAMTQESFDQENNSIGTILLVET